MKSLIRKYLICAGVFAVTMVLSGLWGRGSSVYAADSGYQLLFSSEESYNTVVKTGSYSVKYENDSYYYKKTGSSESYKKLPFQYRTSLYSNGKQVFYTKGAYLMKYIFSSGKAKKVKKLPKNHSDTSFYVSTMYGNLLYLTRSSFDGWEYRTFSYNISTKKLKDEFVGTITTVEDRYAYVDLEFRTDVSPTSYMIYRLSKNGIKKLRKLSSSCNSPVIVSGKLYYMEYPDKKKEGNITYYLMSKGIFYRCGLDGKGKKKLGTFQSKSEYGEIFVSDITSKNCVVMIDSKQYKYTYKTKKLKAI